MKRLTEFVSRLSRASVILLVVCAAATLAWAAEEKESEEQEVKVTLDQLPAPVKAVFEQEAQGGAIKEIEKEVEDGKTTYEAEIVKNGKTVEVEVAEDGKVLEKETDDDEDEDEDEKEPKLTLEQLPAPVRATIERELKGAKIVELEKETEGGKVLYEAELNKGKEKSEIKVAEDGKFLGRELILKLNQLPPAVQAALKTEAQGGKLGKEIEKLMVGGKTVKYTAEIEKDKKEWEVEVAEDGKILKREAAKDEDDDEK